MNLKSKTRHHFNRYAHCYDLYTKLQRDVAVELSELFLPEINDNSVILDAGCGTGYIHELIRKRKFKNQIFQLDIALNMCNIAKEYSDVDNTDTINSDIENMPIKNDSTDIVISSFSLQWTDFAVSMNNLYNILKKNGKIFFTMPVEGSLYQLSKSFIELDNSNRFINFLNINDIRDYMRNTSYTNIHIKEIKITNFYNNSIDIMKSFKMIGAGYNGIKQSNLTYTKLKMLDFIYNRKFGINNKLPLTWSVAIAEAIK